MEESNLIVIVPTKWLTEPLKEFTRTRYPPDKGWPAKGNRSAQLRARVSKLTDADPHWDTKPIRILGKKKTYDDAMRASKVAENESNLETEPELKKRQRVIPKRFCSDSDSHEERPSARTKRRKSKNKQKRVVVIDDDSDNDGAVPPPVVKTSVLQQLKPSVPVRAPAVKPVVLDTLKGLKSAAPNIVKNTGSSAVGGNSHTGLKSVTIAKLLPAGLNISKKTNSSALGKSPRELLKSVTGAPLPAKPNTSKEVNSSALGKSPSELKSVTGTPLPAKPKNMNSSELGKSVTGIKSVTGAPLPAKPNKTNSSALGKSVTGIKSVTGAPLPAETISAKIINSPVVENSHSGLQSVAVMSLLPEVNSVTDINPLEERTLLHSPGSHRNVGDLDIASEPGSDDDPSYGKNNEMRSEENSFGFGSPKGDALGPSGEGAFGSQSDNSLQPSDDGFDDSEGGSHQDGDDQSVEGDLDSSGPDDASSISDEALKVRKSSKRDKKEEDKLVSIVLMKLTQKLDAVLLNQAVIIRAVDPDMAKVIRPAEFPHTPLAKVKHFAKLEKFLKNATNFAAMRDKMWMSIGGCGDERKATGRILTDLFQYSCAKDVSWGGSKGMKCAFGQSETCKALFGAIGMAYKGTDLTQCELKIKDWLRTAPSAYERLMKRKMSKQ